MRVLIPAYEPGEKLIHLIKDIQNKCNFEILVIDDGSGKDYSSIFNQAEVLGAKVLHHPRNLGKGEALKTGFKYLMSIGETEGVVCADCDGQHVVDDICKVAEETLKSDKTAVLGARRFIGKVPMRSRFGNTITRMVFALSAGYQIYDTQTGLRGYPATMLPWLCQIEGSRFEYEINILLKLKPSGYIVREVFINTIYEKGNKSSHFRPLIDSYRVYKPFIKFTASSLLAGLLDFLLLLFFKLIFGQLWLAVLLSRVISSVFNYSCNKNFVFARKQKDFKSAQKYFILVFVIMVLNYILLRAILHVGVPLVFAKIMTEMILFIFGYVLQKRIVFSQKTLKNCNRRRIRL